MSITIQLPSGERRAISQDRILIGRGSHCPIQLPDSGHLQNEHARLRKIADRWMIESRGDWLIRVGKDAPAKFAWLKTGDVIRLSQDGPDLVFEPAHDDVVLAGLEKPIEAVPTTKMPPPLPSKISSFQATPPPLPSESSSRTSSPPPLPQSAPSRRTPPPLPGQESPSRPKPPPLPTRQASRAEPPPLPGHQSPKRPQPPPLPTGNWEND